jgi:hypothetical protein
VEVLVLLQQTPPALSVEQQLFLYHHQLVVLVEVVVEHIQEQLEIHQREQEGLLDLVVVVVAITGLAQILVEQVMVIVDIQEV